MSLKVDQSLADTKILSFLEGTIVVNGICGAHNTLTVDILDWGIIPDIPISYFCQQFQQNGEPVDPENPLHRPVCGPEDAYRAFLEEDKVIVEWNPEIGTVGSASCRVIGFTDGIPRMCVPKLIAIEDYGVLTLFNADTGLCYVPPVWNETLVASYTSGGAGTSYDPSWIVFKLTDTYGEAFLKDVMGGDPTCGYNPAVIYKYRDVTGGSWILEESLENDTEGVSGHTTWPAGTSTCGDTRDRTHTGYNIEYGYPIITFGFSCLGLDFYSATGDLTLTHLGANLIPSVMLDVSSNYILECRGCCQFPQSGSGASSLYRKFEAGPVWMERESAHGAGGAGQGENWDSYQMYHNNSGSIWYGYNLRDLSEWEDFRYPEGDGPDVGHSWAREVPSWVTEDVGRRTFADLTPVPEALFSYIVAKTNATAYLTKGESSYSTWPFDFWNADPDSYSGRYINTSKKLVTPAIAPSLESTEGPFADPGGNQNYVKWRWTHKWTEPQFRTTIAKAWGRGYTKHHYMYYLACGSEEIYYNNMYETSHKYGSGTQTTANLIDQTLVIESIWRSGSERYCNSSVTPGSTSGPNPRSWGPTGGHGHKMSGETAEIYGKYLESEGDALLVLLRSLDYDPSYGWRATYTYDDPDSLSFRDMKFWVLTADKLPETDNASEWAENRIKRVECDWFYRWWMDVSFESGTGGLYSWGDFMYRARFWYRT